MEDTKFKIIKQLFSDNRLRLLVYVLLAIITVLLSLELYPWIILTLFLLMYIGAEIRELNVIKPNNQELSSYFYALAEHLNEIFKIENIITTPKKINTFQTGNGDINIYTLVFLLSEQLENNNFTQYLHERLKLHLDSYLSNINKPLCSNDLYFIEIMQINTHSRNHLNYLTVDISIYTNQDLYNSYLDSIRKNRLKNNKEASNEQKPI